MRLGVLTAAPRVPGRARPVASGHGCGSAAPCQRASRTIASAPTKQGTQDLGRRVLCGVSDPRRPDYSDKVAANVEFRGGGSGSALNRALNKELQQCKSLEELGDTLNSSDVRLDTINIATAWVQLAKVKPFVQAPRGTYAAMSPDVAPLVRLLIGKTIATVHLMELRPLTNCLYGMGKLCVNLEVEPNGHYLAEQVEQRLLMLGEEQGLAEGKDAAQLWSCLHTPHLYPWNTSLTSRLVELSLRDIDNWDSAAVGQTCLYWGHMGIQLAPVQKELFTQRVVSALEDLASDEGKSNETSQRTMTQWVPGAHRLGLKLPAELLRYLHGCLLSMPPVFLNQQPGNLVQYGMALTWIQQLGHQPTAAEAEVWEQRLLHPPPGARWRLSLSELTNGMATLSSMSAYVPGRDVIARAAACVGDPRGCTDADARRLLALVQHWRLPCTQAQAEELKRLANPAGSKARTPGGGGTRPPQQQSQGAAVQQQQQLQQQRQGAGASVARDSRLLTPPPRPGQQGR